MVALDSFLRGSRKFRCPVTIATQQIDFPAELEKSIFTNCSRFIAFASSARDAAFLGKEFGGADGALVAERLPELKTGQAFVKVRGEPVRLLRVAYPGKPTREQIEKGRAMCVSFGKSHAEVDAEIEERRQRFMSAADGASQDKKRPRKRKATTDLPEAYEDF